MLTFERGTWEALGRPLFGHYDYCLLASDYANLVFTLLEGTLVQPDRVLVDDKDGVARVLVEGCGPAEECAAAVLLEQAWPKEFLPVGTRVVVRPASEVAHTAWRRLHASRDAADAVEEQTAQ